MTPIKEQYIVMLKADDNLPYHYQFYEDYGDIEYTPSFPEIKRKYPISNNCNVIFNLLKYHFKDNLFDEDNDIYEIYDINEVNFVVSELKLILEESQYPEDVDDKQVIDSFIVRILSGQLSFDFNISDDESSGNSLQAMLINKRIISILELLGIFRYVSRCKFSFWKGDLYIGFNLIKGYELGTNHINGYFDNKIYGPITDIDDEGELELEDSNEYEFDYYYYNSGGDTVSTIEDIIRIMLFAKRKI